MTRAAVLGMIGVITIATTGGAAEDPSIRTGQGIYRQNCASCHGAKAEGAPDWKKPDENGELPAPPHDATGHTWRHSDAELFEMVAKGWRDPFNKTDRLTMPPFEEQLSEQEMRDVIAYLKTLWSDEQRQFQKEESMGRASPARMN